MKNPKIFKVTQTLGADNRPFQVVLKPAQGMSPLFHCRHCELGLVNVGLAYRNPKNHGTIDCGNCGAPATCHFVEVQDNPHVTRML